MKYYLFYKISELLVTFCKDIVAALLISRLYIFEITKQALMMVGVISVASVVCFILYFLFSVLAKYRMYYI